MARSFGKRNTLLAGEFELNGRRIDLASITVPFLSVVGEKDTITPPATSAPLMDLVGSTDKSELRVPGGHVGLFVGASAAKYCVPGMIDWITAHSVCTATPRPVGSTEP
jgi:polyhydroxyalkanoate synthase